MKIDQWTKSDIHEWYTRAGIIRGCNYLPRTAVNSTEMWQSDTFDPGTIDEELGWAAREGYNGARVFLQYIVWKDDPDGIKSRFNAFLSIAAKHGINIMPILFCDCAFAGREPYSGSQDAPVPGVHNSGWVPSPGLQRVTDQSTWPDLERYVRDMVGAFGKDDRILIWDLYNEPGNSQLGDRSLPLVEATFSWARSMGPQQPLTSGPWRVMSESMTARLHELSDVLSFHCYQDARVMESIVKSMQSYERPILCTEWLLRQEENTFESILPVFARHHVGWYHWGLVEGRTQTYMPWGSKPGDPKPEIWQHDTLKENGKPYDPNEMAMLRAFHFDP